MTLKSVLKQIKSAESSISMFLGIAVVVIVGVLLFNYFRSYTTVSKETKENLAENQKQSGEAGKGTSLPTKYTVVKGDSLWKISEKFYGSGYNWVDISRENGINTPNQIVEGQVLAIPSIAVKKAEAAVKTETVVAGNTGNTITGTKYTVVKGDTLWSISVRAYQDGYKWTEVAKANNLAHPGLIHPGNILTLPR